MTDAQIRRFRDALNKSEAALQNNLWRRDGIDVQRNADPMDEAQYSLDRDLTVRALDRESSTLAAIRSALRRIHEGDFGVCQSCDDAISEKRLAAVPWAQNCIHCQESIDRTLDRTQRFAA